MFQITMSGQSAKEAYEMSVKEEQLEGLAKELARLKALQFPVDQLDMKEFSRLSTRQLDLLANLLNMIVNELNEL